MSTTVSVAGSNYSVPQEGDSGWANDVTNLLIQLATSSKVLQITSTSFPLLQELSFGNSYGLKLAYVKSTATNPSSVGTFRLGNAETISWRNAANNADLDLKVSATDELQYNSVKIPVSGSIVNADINAAAAIAYSKLSLSNSIVNADIGSSAAIAYSKLNIADADLTIAKTSGLQTALDAKLTNPMTTAADMIYGGTSGAPTRLANGNAGKVLVAKGGTTAPAWENLFVGVSAQKNGTQTIGTGADTTITGWTEDFDTNSAFNASTGVFTVPVAGYYQVSAHVEFASGTFSVNETVRAGLKINGSIGVYLFDQVIRTTATLEYNCPCPPYTHNYSVNDTIELTIFQNTGGNRTVSSSGTRTWLSIVKLGNIVS